MGGKNFILNLLRLDEEDDRFHIRASATDLSGTKDGDNYTFDHLKCKSKWLVEPTMDILKDVFKQFNGTLMGQYIDESGKTWGYFEIIKGKTDRARSKVETMGMFQVMVMEAFHNAEMDEITAFVPEFLDPSLKVAGYFQELKVEGEVLNISVLAKFEDKDIVILTETEEWSDEITEDMLNTIALLNSSKYAQAPRYLFCGTTPPFSVRDALQNRVPRPWIMKPETKLMMDYHDKRALKPRDTKKPKGRAPKCKCGSKTEWKPGYRQYQCPECKELIDKKN